MKTVKINWIDSRQIHGWVLEEDIDTTVCEISTCGYLIKETEDSYSVAVSIGKNPLQANGINIIPKACVTDYRELLT